MSVPSKKALDPLVPAKIPNLPKLLKPDTLDSVASSSQVVRPVLKWVGGKTQILDQVLRKFPQRIANYYEPFVGGASVLLGFLSSSITKSALATTKTIVASDINPNIIALYKNVQSRCQEFIQHLNLLAETYNTITCNPVQAETTPTTPTKNTKNPTTYEEALESTESFYYWVRRKYNTTPDRTSAATSAMLLFLNKTCFRGLYREGPSGFNVGFGHYKHLSLPSKEHIQQVSLLIQRVKFQTCSFEQTMQLLRRNDFVYLDPPYAPESSTSFVKYTSNGFDLHAALFSCIHNLRSLKIKFLMSNADVDQVRNAFPKKQYLVVVLKCRRAINSKNPAATTNEVLVSW